MGTQLRIDDGEIYVRGPTVGPGYLHHAPRSGWFRTGDVGYLDQEGYLYVQDRRDDLIVLGGENVYPAEVEAALRAHPAVVDAGVFGVADAEWGAVVCAAVVARSVTAEALQEFCRERLAHYTCPSAIEFGDLPKTSTGKIQKFVLRNKEWAGKEKRIN